MILKAWFGITACLDAFEKYLHAEHTLPPLISPAMTINRAAKILGVTHRAAAQTTDGKW